MCLCLAAVFVRGSIESYIGDTAQVSGTDVQEADQVRQWLDATGLGETPMSPLERELMARPLGTWAAAEMIDVTWRVEAMGVLLWSLGAIEFLPAFDCEFDPQSYASLVPLFGSHQSFVDGARLRPSAFLEGALEVADLWYWRACADSAPPELIAQAAEHGAARHFFPAPLEGDFPAYGKPFAQLGPAERRRVASIALERRHTLRWVCGVVDSWDHSLVLA